MKLSTPPLDVSIARRRYGLFLIITAILSFYLTFWYGFFITEQLGVNTNSFAIIIYCLFNCSLILSLGITLRAGSHKQPSAFLPVLFTISMIAGCFIPLDWSFGGPVVFLQSMFAGIHMHGFLSATVAPQTLGFVAYPAFVMAMLLVMRQTLGIMFGKKKGDESALFFTPSLWFKKKVTSS